MLSHRRALEYGEYGEAFSRCVLCFQDVDSLEDLQVQVRPQQKREPAGNLTITDMHTRQVSAKLRATVQRMHAETQSRLDGALTTICGHFDPPRFCKGKLSRSLSFAFYRRFRSARPVPCAQVMEAYVLQSIRGRQLADKVKQGFKDLICDATTRVVRRPMLHLGTEAT